jgi:glycosyltransferase involved in cell wall biosynthesis
MKILHVNHLLDQETGGGTAERTFQLGRHLAQLGEHCEILTLDIGNARERGRGIERLTIEAVPCIWHRYFIPALSRRRLNEAVGRADIVQIFGNWTLLNALVWRACLRLRKPFVFCPAGALQPFGRSQLLKRVYARWVTGALVRDAARCICITQDDAPPFVELGAPLEKLETIPNGIDPEPYTQPEIADAVARFRSDLGIGDAPFILFLGRLNEIKGPDILLEAFSRIAGRWPAFHLVFAGPDGGMLPELRKAAERAGIAARVHFPGFVSGPAKAAALHAAALLVIPSRREAMSIVVLEAGACGCPVLFTDRCGLEQFQARGAGTMIPLDADKMALAMGELLGQPDELKRQGALLRDIVMNEFLWRAQAVRHRSLYERILQDGRKGSEQMLSPALRP